MTQPFSTVYYFGDSLTDTNTIASAAIAAQFGQQLGVVIATLQANSTADPAFVATVLQGLVAGLGPDPSPLDLASA